MTDHLSRDRESKRGFSILRQQTWNASAAAAIVLQEQINQLVDERYQCVTLAPTFNVAITDACYLPVQNQNKGGC